jgi:hypothetical protein
MNRFTLAVALSVAIAAIGCATGVEDAQEEETVEPQRDPPAQLRSGGQPEQIGSVTGSLDDIRVAPKLPLRQPAPGIRD